MLHLDPIWVDEAVQASGVGQVRQSIVIVDDTEAYRRFCQLNALLFSDADPQLKEVSLTEFVCDTVGVPAIRAESPSALEATYRRLEPVLDMLRGEESGVVSLATLAEQAGMSRYQLIRAFRATTGMTPHAWHLNHRINLAREHLCAGADLARLAHSLGFADQSHFQRMFKAHAGVTPRRYRS